MVYDYNKDEIEKWRGRFVFILLLLILVTLSFVALAIEYHQIDHDNYFNKEELHCLNGYNSALEKPEQNKCLQEIEDGRKESQKWF